MLARFLHPTLVWRP